MVSAGKGCVILPWVLPASTAQMLSHPGWHHCMLLYSINALPKESNTQVITPLDDDCPAPTWNFASCSTRFCVSSSKGTAPGPAWLALPLLQAPAAPAPASATAAELRPSAVSGCSCACLRFLPAACCFPDALCGPLCASAAAAAAGAGAAAAGAVDGSRWSSRDTPVPEPLQEGSSTTPCT
jgi:hypothetical protein